MILPVTLAALGGLLVGLPPPEMATGPGTWWLTVGLLTLLVSSIIFAAIYLPMLQHDYTQFRLRVASDIKRREQREATLKALKEGSARQ